jgi:acetyl esterase/lipase
MRSVFLAAFLCVCFGVRAQRTSSAVPTPAQPLPQDSSDSSVNKLVDLVYGTVDGQKLLLDVYEPAKKSKQTRAAVILLHGGSWSSSDKSTMESIATFLAHNGFVAVAVDFRQLRGSDNRWPAQLDDVQRAVRWLRANAAKYDVDPSRIGAFGQSSGAQLAALLGMIDTRDNSDPALAQYSSRVQCVVDLSGPTDFTRDHDADGDALFTRLLGGDYKSHPDLWRAASPVFHVSKDTAPFLIVHGTRDMDVPIAQSQELNEALKKAGIPVRFVRVDDTHFFQTREAQQTLAAEMLRFFTHYLKSRE